MIEQESLQKALAHWVQSDTAEQPILVLSHSSTARQELCNSAKRSAVCETAQELPCGVCNACKQSDANAHPDTMSIFGENNRIRVQDIKNMRTILTSSSNKRVVCIPFAEHLLPQSANALLKTLEEPGKNTRFLLCAPSKRSVLPTIRSRCRIISMNHATLETVQFSSQEALTTLSGIRPAEPFTEPQLTQISQLIHQMALERGASPDLFKVALRLRDYYKTTSVPGGNVKLAADILLASLANLRNTIGINKG